jgi:hypothetical protein
VANLAIKNGAGVDKFLKASGSGTDLDPQIPEHKETSAAGAAASVSSIDGKTPTLGQALAGASVPVVLTSAQITTLTPPAQISGFATASNQSAANTSLATMLTTLASLLTELQGKADVTDTQPVSFGSMPLPTGAATQATLASILTELQAKANLTQTQPVSLATSPLPTGAATQTTLASLLTELQGKADLAETQPVSAVTLPLPSGAATSAAQTTGNTSLGNLDTKTPALGQALAAASSPVVLTAAQVSTLTPPAAITGFATESTLDTRFGSLIETAPTTDTASSGLNGRLQRIAQRLTSLIALFPSGPGQKTKNASLPVTLASDEDLLALSGAVTEAAPITDTASSGLNGRLQRVSQRLTSLIALLPTSVGQKTKSAALPVTLASDEDLLALSGSITETAPATDTASSGLNGRLQRVSQRLSSLIALLPTSVGQKAKSGSLPVTLASDEDLLAIQGSVTETAPATDTASSGLNGRLQRVSQRLSSLIALLPASVGQKAKSGSLAVTLASDEDLLARQGALTETAPASDTASSGLNGRLQRVAQNVTTNGVVLTNLLTELQLKADLLDTQPVSLASQPLPTGASTEATLLNIYNVFGQLTAVAWGGTGSGSLMQVQKAIWTKLSGTLTNALVDNAGVQISTTNPLQVQIGQLLASQDSVQANEYAMGDSGAAVPVRVATTHSTNVATSWASNATQTLVAAPATGLRVYLFHLRLSVDAGSASDGQFQLLDNTGGTIIERFQCLKGTSVDLWFPNGSLKGVAAQLVAIKNSTGGIVSLANWGVDYAVGA